MKKRICSLLIVVTVIFSFVSLPAVAYEVTGSLPVVKNVRFISDNAEIFEIPVVNKNVSAQVYFENEVEQSVEIIIAAYAGDMLENVSITPHTVIEGYPTLSTSALKVTNDTTRIALMVWKDTENSVPVCAIHELTSSGRDTRLKSFELTLKDGDISKTFEGLINHNEKTVDVYVPTTDIKNNALVALSTGEKNGGASGYTSTFSASALESALVSASYKAIACDENATVEENGVLNLSSDKKIMVNAANGDKAVYRIAVRPVGYIINSNFDSSHLRYNSSEITVKDTQNAWKYEANGYVSTSQNRNLAPSPISTSGFWSYGADTFAIKDKWRYTKADYISNGNTPASSTLFYSRLYTDISYRDDSAANRNIDICVQNDRTGSGSSSAQAQLRYNYTLNNVAELNTFKDGINALVTSFDFNIRGGTPGSGIRFDNGLGEFAVRLHGDSNQKFKIDARAHSSDSAFNGKTKSTYTMMNLSGYDVDTWHNVKIITKNKGETADGKIVVQNSYYIDGNYAGYTYSTDKYSKMWNTVYPSFIGFFNSECTVSIDNFFTGFYSGEELDYETEEALLAIEKSVEGVVPWLANLYDSKTGGFYMAMSGKADPEMEPALEMTAWGIGILSDYTDCFDDMPENIRQKFIDFFNERQDPQSGYFVDKQGETNEREHARNQSSSLSALSNLGAAPLYFHPSYQKSAAEISLMSVSQSSDTMPDYMESPEAYVSWMQSFDWENASWSAGDKVQASQVHLSALDSATRKTFTDAMFEWFEENQNVNTGLWSSSSNYNSVSGAFKVGLIYSKWGKQLPLTDKIINSILECYRTDEPDSPYYIRNPLSLLSQIAGYSRADEIKVRNIISKNLEVILPGFEYYLCPDGGFSASYRKSMKSFGGVEGSHGLYEGDIDATLMMLIARSNLYDIIGLEAPHLDGTDFWKWISGEKEMPSPYRDVDILEKAHGDVFYDFEEFENGYEITGEEFGKTAILSTIEDASIVDDTDNAGNKVLSLTYKATSETGPNIYFKNSVPQIILDDGQLGLKTVAELDFKFKDMINDKNIYFSFGSDPSFALSLGGFGEQTLSYRVASDKITYKNPISTLEPDKWYTFRVEYEVSEDLTDANIKLYIDGNKVGDTSYYYGCHKDTPPEIMDKYLTVSFYKKGSGTVLLDNIRIEK